MRRHNSKGWILGFSPWLLAIASSLLVLLLTLFALSNYKREKRLIQEALDQKGLTLVRFINSAAREAMRASMRYDNLPFQWVDQVAAAMAQAAEQPGVDFVLLLGEDASEIASAGTEKPSAGELQLFEPLIDALRNGQRPFVFRFVEVADGTTKYQLAAYHLPPDFLNRGGMGGRPRGMMRRFSQHHQFAEVREDINRLAALHPLFLVQLDVAQFNAPLKRQLIQIFILLAVLILVGIGGTLSSMTLRGLKGSQQRLGSIRAFTDILISSLPVGLIATDHAGEIRVCNPMSQKVLGAGEEDLLGHSPWACLPPELAEIFAADREDGRVTEARLRGTGDTPSERILHLTGHTIRDDNGQSAGKVLLMRDMTAIKTLEEDLRRSERMAALGRMAAGVAHELRNPLSSIKGLGLLLKSDTIQAKEKTETADILIKEVERLNRSIEELLDYARPASLRKRTVAIGPLLEKAISLITADAKATNIDIECKVDADVPLVELDTDKFNQVLLNLMLNGLQAMTGGGRMVVGGCREGDQLVIFVRDTGVGISQELVGKIFDPYFTTKSDGSGLGLALSLKIVEEHGGTMAVASTPGEGTEMRVHLPCPPDPRS